MSCTHLTFFEKAARKSKAQYLLDMLDEMEPAFRRAFLEMEGGIRSELTIERLLSYLERGDAEAALRIVQRHATRLANILPNFQATSGQAMAQMIESKTHIVIDYNRLNPRALEAANNARLRLIRDITNTQRSTIQQAIVRGVREGLNPRAVARDIRNAIGLTPAQEAHVANYRAVLERGSRAALSRQLRDRRFDRTVNAAARDRRPIPSDVIDRMVERYRQNYVAHRAEMIARTESLRSVHEGQQAMMTQAIEDGAVDPNKMKQTWITAHDDRVRDSHLPMDGQVKAIGEPFITGEGAYIRFPGDPDAGAEEVIGCRCVVAFQFK